ncbi:MAG: AAA domain-containing protein [Saprospiraceae bacterium]|nr:AAA domain-containing protein [Saprospiraceae bacterium]
MEKIEDIQKLRALLALEKKADLEFFKSVIQNKPLEQRRAEGFTWFPLSVVRTGYTYGDRAFVVVERSGNPEVPHQFRSGNVVQLFSRNVGKNEKLEKAGVLNYVNKNQMYVILNSKDLPDWLNEGNIGVDLLFDDRTYMEMERALDRVEKAKGDRLAELRDILLGVKASSNRPFYSDKQAPNPASDSSAAASAENNPSKDALSILNISLLNESQNRAVFDIVNCRDVAIIHGPPGTGKTTTLVAAVKKMSETENTILVTAPSNTAADLLTERLSAQNLNVVRVGNISRVDENIVRHTLEGQLSAHPESKNIKKIKIKAAELRRIARTYKRKFGYDERSQRELLKKEANDMAAWANELEKKLIEQILDAADVIICTLVASANSVLDGRKFRTVVIDEAAQALEPAAWIPILKASRVILAGDPFQLPPTVKSQEAKRGGFDQTLLEKCLVRLPSVNFLDVQYRMNAAIMGFSNRWFYDGLLRAHPSVIDRQMPILHDEKAVVFIDTAGCGFDEKIHLENKSRFNPEEFFIVREHLYQFLQLFAYEKPSVGLISPYREQVVWMKNDLENDEILRGENLTVQTIDGFQGQERDVIYISLVRSNTKAEIGFLTDYRRMNVAMTRAKMKLVVVGDSGTIGNDKFYKEFLEYVETAGTYRSAWEFMKP